MKPHAVAVIAWTTTLEAMRNKLLLVGIAFGLVLVGLSVTAAAITIGERARLIIDVGLAAASVIGSIMTIAVTVTSFAGEIRKHTAFPVLARPISRSAFILGKYLGVVSAMAMVVTTMILATALTTWAYGAAVPAAVGGQWLLALVEVAIVAAVAMLFSTVAVPALAAMYAAGVVLAGDLAQDLWRIGNRQLTDGDATGHVLHAVYYVLPDLEKLSVRAQAANDFAVPFAFVGYGVAYGLVYAAIMLILAMIVFEKRRAV